MEFETKALINNDFNNKMNSQQLYRTWDIEAAVQPDWTETAYALVNMCCTGPGSAPG